MLRLLIDILEEMCLASEKSRSYTTGFPRMGMCGKIVYAKKIRDLRQLRERIYAGVAILTPGMLCHTWDEIECGLDVCRATNGAHN
jgi:hypothetical protein